ncbi:putative beta-lactamase superfamily domain containing protein [Lyophyllum shimeji]|uniref:Beta-lactamase superfamily domain containing protein n=1 Tax=Lyophyllum shimeji TaxID=47721 RepID=A0A9P3UJK4_LYOSH|nr:putative beta-lactamase superfamily domain containing protein [Lyophyllum shimeji]
MTLMRQTIKVFETVEAVKLRKARTTPPCKPSHWIDEAGTRFKNPWPSFRPHDASDQFYIIFQWNNRIPKVPGNVRELIPIRQPTWGAGSDDPSMMKATWLGHASVLLELPCRSQLSTDTSRSSVPSRGIRILFDPIFSDYPSPVQCGPLKRYSPPPCQVTDVPEIDAVIISHDHYDHLDANTIRSLMSRNPKPHVFAPAGTKDIFTSMGVPSDRCHILDWWDTRRLSVELPARGNDDDQASTPLQVDITCTPSQHNSGRAFMDRFFNAKTLWSSWAVEEVFDAEGSTSESNPGKRTVGKKAYFAGDTGYQSILQGQEYPPCPVFKEIGERFGGFDLAMIPIGAYRGTRYMSPVHCSPWDSVRVFQDVKAKKALAVHWGTWILSEEEVDQPPKDLKTACTDAGIEEGSFVVCDMGETPFF